ncbi:uncharacterized protein LAESUDRAFT_715331 [Laetiporus sulphureus 93-53]|uniref:Uncharacterized protein n=1 Tax=Laetiporus sulphureus 93-53 TaxID=1314785 RepID=A0A165DFK8_9APHY|nr:uncharacterized protein LAESUDRAFT_715331 [Laetiporus sulphureus 93-53]KZT04787.1 hypothetical protein LAESUDRAFT_715331 [Laetiporus sulphureus 93-53]
MSDADPSVALLVESHQECRQTNMSSKDCENIRRLCSAMTLEALKWTASSAVEDECTGIRFLEQGCRTGMREDHDKRTCAIDNYQNWGATRKELCLATLHMNIQEDEIRGIAPIVSLAAATTCTLSVGRRVRSQVRLRHNDDAYSHWIRPKKDDECLRQSAPRRMSVLSQQHTNELTRDFFGQKMAVFGLDLYSYNRAPHSNPPSPKKLVQRHMRLPVIPHLSVHGCQCGVCRAQIQLVEDKGNNMTRCEIRCSTTVRTTKCGTAYQTISNWLLSANTSKLGLFEKRAIIVCTSMAGRHPSFKIINTRHGLHVPA